MFGCESLFISWTSFSMFALLLFSVFIFKAITWSEVLCLTYWTEAKNGKDMKWKTEEPVIVVVQWSFMTKVIHIPISADFVTELTFYKHTMQMWNGTLLFSCNSWWQKAWEVEKHPTISFLVQVKEVISLSTEKKFPTPRPMKLIFIPRIPFFPPAVVAVIVHRMHYMRTGYLQLQGRFWRYSVFTSENRWWSSFHIQGTESIPANPCCKAERFLHKGSPHPECH